MTQEKKERLKLWFESLDQPKQIEIALECIEELIFTESIRFYDTTKVPYWDVTGYRLDGSEFNDED